MLNCEGFYNQRKTQDYYEVLEITQTMKPLDMTIGFVGSGGEGVVSAGEILVWSTAAEGLYGMMIKSYGPQIRGGESAAQIRLSSEPVLSQGDKLDALVVLSWQNFARFEKELVLGKDTIVFHDKGDEPPANLSFPHGIRFVEVPMTEEAKERTGNTLAKNLVALGFLVGSYRLPERGFYEAIRQRFERKGEAVLEGNMQAFRAGFRKGREHALGGRMKKVSETEPDLLVLSGNDALAMGALFAGVRFYAGYPITPASEIMEWMAKELPKFGGTFIQTEDEIAALTMAIGASFAGQKAMTATSGPGLSLMTEALDLAAMAELPVVVADVQRAGPSTGIPTKTTQSDLFHAIYGGHGDLPRVVLAPTDVTDAFAIAVHAVYLSEKYQVPVLILSDQFLGQRVEVIPNIDFDRFQALLVERLRPSDEELVDYRRFMLTETGVSPLSHPGIRGGVYTAAGIEHDEHGRPTSDAEMHERMSAKRAYKLTTLARAEEPLVWRSGPQDAAIGVLAWGSSKGVVEETQRRLRNQGVEVAVMVPRRLSPLPTTEIQQFVDHLDSLLIVEMSHGAQFYRYLRSEVALPEKTSVTKRTGAAPFKVEEIMKAINEVQSQWKTTRPRTIEVA